MMAAGANLLWHFAPTKPAMRQINFKQFANVRESERKSFAASIQI